MSSGRFVWISDDESIERLGAVEFARLVTKRRADAPADPAVRVRSALIATMAHDGEARWSDTEPFVQAVLRALGLPDE